MGTVYLVGGGPGDPGLLTRRAAGLLRRADIVIHDALISPAILDLISPDAERIDVGKRYGGRHTPQDETNRLLVEAARRARVVVRLKGGDPFIFGRGGEEALHLREAGIRFRVVPGVTAAVGAAAYAGIPLTHREVATSVTFVTGHECVSSRPGRTDWEALARSGGTLAIYMGVSRLPKIVRRLVDAGRAPDTPAAVIEWGTYAVQRTVAAPLSEIAEAAQRAGLGAPALVVVGDVAALRERLGWFERRPLRGSRVLVGRSRPQPSRLAKRLRSLGAEVTEFPRVRVAPPADPQPLRRALDELSRYGWVVFTSPTAVDHFWAELRRGGGDARALAGVRFGAFGTATGRALSLRGIHADLALPTFDADAVATALLAPGDSGGAGKRVLFPRETGQPSPIARRLAEAGIRVDEVEAYRHERDLEGADELRAALGAGEFDAVALPSSLTAREIAAALGTDTGGAPVMAIGPETAQTALALGLPVHTLPSEHNLDGLVRGVRELLRPGRRAADAPAGPDASPHSGAGPGGARLASQP